MPDIASLNVPLSSERLIGLYVLSPDSDDSSHTPSGNRQQQYVHSSASSPECERKKNVNLVSKTFNSFKIDKSSSL